MEHFGSFRAIQDIMIHTGPHGTIWDQTMLYPLDITDHMDLCDHVALCVVVKTTKKKFADFLMDFSHWVHRFFLKDL